MFSGGLEDEQGKYNLYNLARAGVPQPAEEQVLLRLLGLLRLPDTLAPRIIDIVAMGQPPAQPAEAPPSAAQPPARARCRAACRNWAPRWAWIPPCATNCNAP